MDGPKIQKGMQTGVGGQRKSQVVSMRGTAALLLLIALPNIVAAQDVRMERIRQAFSPEAVAQIESIVVEAEAAGVPADPLLDKALEGAAKGIPTERVVVALASYSQRLAESRSILGSEYDAASVVAGADALRRGITPETMRSLSRSHPEELAVPLVVMGDLVEAGVPQGNALTVMQEALAKQHGPEDMLAIPGAVRRLMREGQSASDAAGSVGKAIGRGRLRDVIGPPGQSGAAPPKGPPVPPGSGPPDHAGPKKEKGKGKPPPGGA
jgi:hypothetical protein